MGIDLLYLVRKRGLLVDGGSLKVCYLAIRRPRPSLDAQPRANGQVWASSAANPRQLAQAYERGPSEQRRGSASSRPAVQIRAPPQVTSLFRTLNGEIHRLCENTAASISLVKELPKRSQQEKPYKAVTASDVERPRWQFSSVYEYSFFALLSIINGRLYHMIFLPFHPSKPNVINEPTRIPRLKNQTVDGRCRNPIVDLDVLSDASNDSSSKGGSSFTFRTIHEYRS